MVAVSSASRMSTRGTMTSRATVSPSSKISVIIRFSSSSSVPCSVTRSLISSSETPSPTLTGLQAEQPADEVGRAGEQPDDRRERLRDARDRPGHRDGDALGAHEPEALGGELAEDERHVRDAERDDHQRQRPGDPESQAMPERLEPQPERLLERHRGERRGQEADERDADLDGREHAGWGPRSAPARRCAPDEPSSARCLSARAACGDERDLGCGEPAVHEDEHEYERDLQAHTWHSTNITSLSQR